MIVLRKERKEYGTKSLIEGNFKKGDQVLLIEDVTTTGSSILESKQQLESEGLIVKTVVSVIDRRPELVVGVDMPIEIKSLLTLKDIFESIGIHEDDDKIDKLADKQADKQVDNIDKIDKQVDKQEKQEKHKSMKGRSFNSTFATQLWNIMQTKKTNLCLSLDSMDNIVSTLESVGDYICLLKLHCDISDSISSDDVSGNENTLPYIIHRISRDKNFLILDDRKYADIGHIARQQLSYCPLINVDSCTVHSIFGQLPSVA